MIQGYENKKDENLDKLTNKELRSKILEINNEQLYKIRYMSYYFFIAKSGELMKFIEEDKFGEKLMNSKEKETLIKNFNLIISLFKTLQEDNTYQQVQDHIETLLKARKELYNLSQSLYAYEIELSYIKELLDYHIMNIMIKNEYKNTSLNEQDIKLLINKTNKILDSNLKDNSNFVNIVSNVLNMMPFRMSKLKYFSLIKDNLIAKFEEYPVELIEYEIKEYKKIFDSSLVGDYGVTFLPYFTDIQGFKNRNMEKLSLEQLESMAKDIIDLTNEINRVKIFINTVGVLTNRLILMISSRNKTKVNKDSKDLFLRWEKLQKNLDKNLLNSIILESDKKSKEIENQLLNDIDYFQAINNEGVKREGFFDEKLDKEVLFAKKMLTYYNDINFTKHEILFLKNTKIVKYDYLEQLVENLIQYINRSIGTMNNIERKLRMRRFLSFLELPFLNVEEFLSYIEYSLDPRLASKEEILFTIDNVNYWFDSFNKTR